MSLPYRIERTRNRTSRASFTDDGILIRLARNLPKREEERHIRLLLSRMTKRAAQHLASPRIDPFVELLRGGETLMLTVLQNLHVEFAVARDSRTKATKTPGGWSVTWSHTMPRDRFHRFLWRLLSLSCTKHAWELVRSINDTTFRGDVASVRLRYMRARFGSCGRRGQIALNTALLFVPAPLLEYVIVHELAHIGHPNHSGAFWEAVENEMPDFRDREKELKRYRLPHM